MEINRPGGPHQPPTARLCLLLFSAYAIMGAWLPVFSLHLDQLGFSPEQTAWASSTNAIGLLFAPLLWGQLADRWMASERCISLCALCTFLILWFLAGSTSPPTVFCLSVLVWFFLNPINGLSSSLVFRQLEHPERDFGRIRLWGTIGWAAASWCVTLWLKTRAWLGMEPGQLSDSLRLGGLAGLFVAVYALTLPHTPPHAPSDDSPGPRGLVRLIDAPVRALALFRDRTVVVFCACYFVLYVTYPFTQQLNPLLLKKIGIDAAILPVCLTIAQSSEVLFLALLPMLLRRRGMKVTMMLGGSAWTLGLILLGVGSPVWLVLAALGSHGIFICCFVVAGQVFVNRQATHDIRATAQGLLLFVSGSGLFLGHMLVGWIRDWTADDFHLAYAIAAVMSSFAVFAFYLGFASDAVRAISTRQPESLVDEVEIPGH
jgi:MFS family permease